MTGLPELVPPGVRVILASTSPRRRELLAETGLPFEIIAPDVDEIRNPDESAQDFAVRAAREKATAVAASLPHGQALVIGADTIVVVDDEVLGKPSDSEDAKKMLWLLNGRTHRVITGIAMIHVSAEHEHEIVEEAVTTEVTFRELHAEEIDLYVASGEPMDKAGAYAIQGGAAAMVTEVRGSYKNVVGLPTDGLAHMFRSLTRA